MRSFDQPMIDLNDKSILVTGGTGSFGHAFVSEVVKRFTPHRLIVFSRDELKQHEMAQRFGFEQYPFMRYFIGDVRDVDRLEMAMRDVDYVVHAAALKHVPIAEYNPFECIQTNIHGAENVVKAALRCQVKRVVGLSTDKAASPINLYGASKLASDKILVAANNLSAGRAKFGVVRYGNVIGSRGSVVPLFNRIIGEGANSLPITDERMTRFWITLQQGVNFVLSSLALMQGGEIFVPKIPSMKIVDLAKAMAPGLRHEVVGIRPGEKVHEVMITSDDARLTVELDDRYVVCPGFDSSSPEYYWFNIDYYDQKGARRLSDGFRYGSENNQEWLDGEQLREMLSA